MITIHNKTRKPIQVHAYGGKKLYLGPGKTGEVSDQTAEMPSFRKLIDGGLIELVEGVTHAGGTTGEGPAKHASTHGYPPTTVVTPKGDR